MTAVNNHDETIIFAPLTLTLATSGLTSSTDMTPGAYFLTILESTLVYEQRGISMGDLWGRTSILQGREGSRRGRAACPSVTQYI